ncbi:MAG: hypothetical protein V7L00_17865 [Nostoc sp.]|uniref:hypothetical protein n=1 Tax=Nostoc sp. TaxID=1180 RepID=UPI002FFBC947
MLRPGQNSTSFPPGWNHGKTQTIRVPIALADQILDYARTLDSTFTANTPETIPELLQGDFLQIIDRYINWRTRNYRSTKKSKKPDITARTWDELRKFQKLLRECPELFQD